MKLQGFVQFYLDSALVHESHNMVTLAFRSGVAAMFTGSALDPPTAIALGTGTASASNISASGLHFEVARTATVRSAVPPYTTAAYVANFGVPGVTRTLTEAGLFNNGSANSAAAFCVIAPTPFPWSAAQQLSIVWYLTPYTGSAN